MSELLMGKETSGTPIETRRGTKDLASLLQGLMRGGGGARGLGNISEASNALTSDALMALFSDPLLGTVIGDMLASPADQTRGLFSSMIPFEQETMEREVAGTRNIFGTMGGRFSRNVGQAEAETRSRVAGEFGRNREAALLQAGGLRSQGLMGILEAANMMANRSMAPLELMARFFQPGAPQYQEGILPGLLQAGSTLGAMALFPPAAPAIAAGSAAGSRINKPR